MVVMLALLLVQADKPDPKADPLSHAADRAIGWTVEIEAEGVKHDKWVRKIGTGTVIDQIGTVATCAHVLGKDQKVRIRLADGTTRAARVLGRFPEHDLSFLRFNPIDELENPPVLTDRLAPPGTPGLCLGFPGGKRRLCSATMGDYVINGQGVVQAGTPIIVFQASVEPGYSGGPFLDYHGNLIGVVIAKSLAKPQQAIAVPTSVVLKDLQRCDPKDDSVPSTEKTEGRQEFP